MVRFASPRHGPSRQPHAQGQTTYPCIRPSIGCRSERQTVLVDTSQLTRVPVPQREHRRGLPRSWRALCDNVRVDVMTIWESKTWWDGEIVGHVLGDALIFLSQSRNPNLWAVLNEPYAAGPVARLEMTPGKGIDWIRPDASTTLFDDWLDGSNHREATSLIDSVEPAVGLRPASRDSEVLHPSVCPWRDLPRCRAR